MALSYGLIYDAVIVLEFVGQLRGWVSCVGPEMIISAHSFLLFVISCLDHGE